MLLQSCNEGGGGGGGDGEERGKWRGVVHVGERRDSVFSRLVLGWTLRLIIDKLLSHKILSFNCYC